jgi:hypothetical protein
MKHNKIALLYFITFIFASIFIGCKDPTISIVQNNPTNEASGTSGDGNNGSGGNPEGSNPGTGGVTIGDDGTVNITSRNVIYIGEGSETVDSITYLVKKYAELTIEDNPYFYTYYKFYYLGNKLRRVEVFNHGVGSDMDYKYTEFVEHTCGQTSIPKQIYTYHENGKLASYIYTTNSAGIDYRYETYFNENGIRTSYLMYSNDSLYTEYEYYPNGKNKVNIIYNTNPSYILQKTTYYEDGKIEYQITYSGNNVESTKYYYAYYDSGNKKTYEYYINGKPYYLITYFDKNVETKKLYVLYNNSDQSINSLEFYYDSEFLKYYYTPNYLYTYNDNKTKTYSTDSSVYSNRQTYTDSQAKNLIQSLRN